MGRDDRRPRRGSRVRFEPAFDPMEERTLLSTLTVTNNHDSGPGSLRAEIAAAAGGDTIVFSPKLDGQTITLTGGELTIGKSLDIEGPGARLLTVSGDGKGRVFDITTSGVFDTIAGLTITGGVAEQGGGILDQGGALTLSDDMVVGNRALAINAGDPALGGGVAVTSDAAGNPGTLIVQGSRFVGNRAQGYVGVANSNGPSGPDLSSGGDARGGAIEADPGTSVTVSTSSFDSNQALGGPGGTNPAAVSGSGNGGGASGGAIFGDTDVPISVASSRFDDNQAVGGQGGNGGQDGFASGGTSYGGAIYASGWSYSYPPNPAVSLDVSHSSFVGNIARGGDGGQGQVTDFSARQGGYAAGGAIVGEAGTDDISSSQFIANRALGGRGGDGPQGGNGAYTGGGAILSGSLLNVSDSDFQQNVTRAGDGGTSTQSPQRLHGFSGSATGGAIEADGDLAVSGSRFTGNVAQGGTGNFGGEGWGGGIFVAGNGGPNPSTFTISGTRFTANQAIGGDGTSGDLTNPGQPLGQYGGDGLGGGLMTPSFGLASGTISGCAFDGNVTLGGNGGAGGPGARGGHGGFAGGSGIYYTSYADTLDVESTRFIDNRATAGKGGDGGAGANGGAGGYSLGVGLYNQGATLLTLNRSSFVGNTGLGGAGGAGGSGGNGGAGGNAQGGGFASDAIGTAITASSFIGNVIVGGAGGPAGAGGNGGDGGSAYGGGLELEGDTAVSSSQFSLNVAIGGAGGAGGGGGGLALGGGIAEDSDYFTDTLTNSSVTFNAAIGGAGGKGATGGDALGGGIGIMGFPGGPDSYTVTDSTIDANRALGGAGGTGAVGGDGLGGGIYADASTDLSLMHVRIQYNRAIGGEGGAGASDGQGIGGGVYVLGTFSEDSSTVITKNHASTSHDNVGP